MSQHSTLPTRERKLQAAAICREIRGGARANGDTMDLGKKLSTPKDIMLEELSLLSNRGSRLFKMRQRRSDKYTFESIQNNANTQLNAESRAEETHTSLSTSSLDNPANPENIAPGYGGPMTNISPEKFNSNSVPYHSPWVQAIISDPTLADTLNLCMPVPEHKDLEPHFKSFNRVATPFGGFDKAKPRAISFKMLEVDLNPPKYPELQDPGAKRPSFNRTAQGWVSDGTAFILPTVTKETPESDDL